MAFIDALVGGGLAMMGARDTNQSNAKTAATQMSFEGDQAALNRDWQAYMSGTAHRREMSDLRQAGLNPILTATGGAGASTPSGATARGAGYPSHSELGEGVSSALAARRAGAEVKNMEEMNKNIDADTDLKRTQRTKTSQDWNTSRAEEGRINDEAALTRLHTQLQREQLPGARTEGDIDRGKWGRAFRYTDRAAQSINSAIQGIRALRGGFNQR